ncbi:MAG: TrmO family methyltransferase [Desulfobacterales bacterium]
MNENTLQCSDCGQWTERAQLCFIEDTPFCLKCMYGDEEPVQIYPIGTVRNNLGRDVTKQFGRTGDAKESRIELLASQKPFMYKLEEEEYLTIVYYLHKTLSPRYIFKRRNDMKEVGTFASRSPNRLSKLAITDVKLIRIEDTTLIVSGLDAINGSPVLDVKTTKKDWYY